MDPHADAPEAGGADAGAGAEAEVEAGAATKKMRLSTSTALVVIDDEKEKEKAKSDAAPGRRSTLFAPTMQLTGHGVCVSEVESRNCPARAREL